MKKADLGVVGLAVMGKNLALNLSDHGFKVAIYNRTSEKVKELEKEGPFLPATNLKQFFEHLKRPKIALLMVKAGSAVDEMIELSLPYLEKGDILIDGGNSHYLDTVRRQKMLEEKGIFFCGMGVSGGEEGARKGPAIMFGGEKQAWNRVKSFFIKIAAKTSDGASCAGYVGMGGAGHYVKMVHNGIEYADMELIAESYDFLKNSLEIDNREMSRLFEKWNRSFLKSYLIEITAAILKKKEGNKYLLDLISDRALQKGTGRWLVEDSLRRQVPLNIIAEAVGQRILSADSQRERFREKIFKEKEKREKQSLEEILPSALFLGKILAYAQGFYLLKKVSEEEGWAIDLKQVALLWRDGCIIRGALLKEIAKAKGDVFCGLEKEIKQREGDLREMVARLALNKIPAPAFFASLSYLDSLQAIRLPTSLIQAQRDFFGAHTYERVDRKRGEFFHTDW